MRPTRPLSLIALCCALSTAPAAPLPAAPGLVDLEDAPRPAQRQLAEVPQLGDLAGRIDTHFLGAANRRLHVQLDRPLFRPGETVWLKTWNLATRGLSRDGAGAGVTVELIDPRGQVVETKQLLQDAGTATNDFVLATDAPGGRWTIRATAHGGQTDERPFVVASYSTPRIQKKLDFLREAYGPGEKVEALVELGHGTGGPLADHPVRALLQVDGQTVLEQALRTDATGAVYVAAKLPAKLSSGDGLLTVLVDDGGVTESISRSVPIVLADLQLAFFPEGGQLVTGLPGRVYFEATDAHGEPADVSGAVTDDRGTRVASFSSVHDGLGRFAFTPQPGRRYTATITEPAGIAGTYALPAAQASGCTLRSYDDVRSELPVARVGVRCTKAQDVVVTGVLRDQAVDTARVRASSASDTVVHLKPPAPLADAQGALRVTVFDRALVPLAERLIYRNPGRDLQIALSSDRETYGPRDEVVLPVRATTPSGAPVQAELALSVVDDAVVSLADDENGHALTRIYLEPELVDSPDDPAWYFDADEPLAARGLDLVMGTKGWRRFDWQPVWNPPEPEPEPDWSEALGYASVAMPMDELMPMAALDDMDAMQPPPGPPPMAAPPPPMQPSMERDLRLEVQAKRPPAEEHAASKRAAKRRVMAGADREDEPWGRHDRGYVEWAPVRVFPRPAHGGVFSGTRDDFRDTVHWEPTVRTDADGKGEVRFHLSDAITQLRVTAEGTGGGLFGHAETTFASILPLSLAAKLPAHVSAGDRVLVPVTVDHRGRERAEIAVSASVDHALVKLGAAEHALRVDGGKSATWWLPLKIGDGSGTASLDLVAEGGGNVDRMARPLEIVPPGFPRAWSASGESVATNTLTFQLDAWVPGSLTAAVTWHPSPVSGLISGLEGMIGSPGGCFEQTSSTNWPNVAILNYLEANDGDPRLRAASAQHLQVGYDKLTGYQVSAGGFETWGSGPGKEVLSAFGLLQFHDMRKVYPVKPAVLADNERYLLSQRDGRGGFKNTGESAHGYGSAPQPVVDGFITWSLVAAGHRDDLAKELAQQASIARATKDPYVLALAARSLVASGSPEAKAALDRLAGLQAADGSFPGAESSITRSYEANLLVESTALAALALLDGEAHRGQVDKAVAWITANRQGHGTWGATQATALALGALTAYAEQSRRPSTPGHLLVELNGKQVGTLRYEADQSAPLVIDGFADALRQGENTLVLRHDGETPLPFTASVAWSTLRPASAPKAELTVQTTLDRATAPMGETVRLTAKVANQTKRVQPSPIARIGIPAGLEVQTWQLEELKKKGVVAFWETRPREVTLYWDGLHAGATHEVKLDLLAAVPGEFTGPASSAYPYYDDDDKGWADGLKVKITPPAR